jgi:hypothetical protein
MRKRGCERDANAGLCEIALDNGAASIFWGISLAKSAGTIRQGVMPNWHFYAVIPADETGGMSFAVPTSSRF